MENLNTNSNQDKNLIPFEAGLSAGDFEIESPAEHGKRMQELAEKYDLEEKNRKNSEKQEKGDGTLISSYEAGLRRHGGGSATETTKHESQEDAPLVATLDNREDLKNLLILKKNEYERRQIEELKAIEEYRKEGRENPYYYNVDILSRDRVIDKYKEFITGAVLDKGSVEYKETLKMAEENDFLQRLLLPGVTKYGVNEELFRKCFENLLQYTQLSSEDINTLLVNAKKKESARLRDIAHTLSQEKSLDVTAKISKVNNFKELLKVLDTLGETIPSQKYGTVNVLSQKNTIQKLINKYSFEKVGDTLSITEADLNSITRTYGIRDQVKKLLLDKYHTEKSDLLMA